MALSRRTFLKLVGGTSAGAAILSACRPATRELLVQSPVKMPEDMVSGVDNWYATQCNQCAAGCGTIVRIVEGRAKKVEGNPLHPISMGKLCVRGHGATQELYHPDRIRRPMRATGARGSGQFEEISWETALDEVAAKLTEARAKPNSIIFATEPLDGHLSLVATRFNAALGSTHASFEPMDRTVLTAAINQVFGTPRLPHFDIANTKYILSFGADFLMGWISQVKHSRGYGDFRQGEGRERGYFVQVDSRFTGTAANADEWVPVKPGTEGKLALAIAHVIVRDNLAPGGAALGGAAALAAYAPAAVASATGVPAERIEKIAKDFASHQPGIAIGGDTAGSTTNGLFNLAAIYALNQLVGNVGKKGGVLLNPASPLATDPLFRDVTLGESRATSLKDWQGHIDRMKAGTVSVLLVKEADLAYGVPASLGVQEALAKVPFVASFSSFLDDTTLHADIILPTSLLLEDWGDRTPNPGPGYQTITFQQPVVRPFHDTRGFGDVLLALAQDLKLERQLPWTTFRDVLREGAQKLFQMKRGNVKAASFEGFWNELLRQGGWWDEGARAAAPASSAAIALVDPGAEFAGDPGEFPYVIVPFPGIGIGTGKQAHLPWMQSVPDPVTTASWITWVEVNSKDAHEQNLREGDTLNIDVPGGTFQANVYLNPALPHGVLAIPLGQGHKSYGRFADRIGSNVLQRLAPSQEKGTAAMAWGATRAKISKAGTKQRMPKFEGNTVAVDFNHEILVIKGE